MCGSSSLGGRLSVSISKPKVFVSFSKNMLNA